MTDLFRAFGQNDIEDFERHIARCVRGRQAPDCEELELFLRANPGMTVRDWKGMGPSVPPEPETHEKPWHRLKQAEVREAATTAFARELPHNIRQAAARDPSLIWNPLARKYRVRLPSDALLKGRGVTKVNGQPKSGPALATESNANTKSRSECAPTRARNARQSR